MAGRIFRGYQQGVLATVPAMVLASAVAAVAGWPSPLEAVAEELMVWTPVGAATLLLLHAGALARPAALLGALAVSMVFGGMAGALRSTWGGCGHLRSITSFLLATAFLGAIFLWLIPSSVQAPQIVFIAAFLLTLALFPTSDRAPRGRRDFLLHSGVILGGAAILLTLFSVRPLLRALSQRRLFPYRPPRGLAIAGITELVTPPDQFYVMDKELQYPEVGPPSWNLTVDGKVQRPLTLDYGAMLARPSRSLYVTMECVDNPIGGPLIGNALWTGVPVSDLLRAASATGNEIVFRSADGYSESAPRRLVEEAGALIAYGMNGETLPRAHGYPARLLLPGIYGFKSVKWLQRLEVVDGSYGGDWRDRGWTTSAEIHTTTRIDLARRTGGEILLAGVAFAGRRGIRAVEVRANGGPWRRATLGSPLSRDTWVQWAIRLRGRGTAMVEVRAIDGIGRVQTARRHGAYPNGSTGWATVTV